ncbi:MAG TPA: PAS domain S-box protein [Syntrophales bacterium]|nr:PAS domain S-box protein [Syntrophales bacterium]
MSIEDTVVTTEADQAIATRELIAELQRNKAWFFAMADEAPMGISISRDGINLYANRACLRMFGYDNPQEMTGTSQMNRVAPDYRWQMNLYINKRKRGETVPNQYEFMGLRKDGSTFPVFVEVARIRMGETTLSVAFFTNFTERKRIEAALSSSEKRYRNLVGTITDVITETDARGNFVFASPPFFSLYGVEPADLVNKTPFDFMIPADAVRCRRLFEEKAKKKEKIEGLEYTVTLRDGQTRTMEMNASPYINEKGQLAGYCALTRDITSRKEMEQALRGSEQRYRSLVESIDEFIAENDANGVNTYASPRAFDFLGYLPEELFGKTPFDFMTPDETARVREIFNRAVSRGEPLLPFEYTILHKSGKPLIMETSGMPFFSDDGILLGYRTISRDITKRKEASEALARAEAKYRGIVENAVEGIYRSLPTGRYVDANPAFARLFGYDSPEELIKAVNDIGQQLYLDPEVRKECVRVVEERGHGSFEIGIRRRDGSTGWVFNNVQAVRDAQGKTIYYEGFIEDITDRKRMEEELRKAHTELEERIRERTAELAQVNETLRLDIEKRREMEEALRQRESERELHSRKLEDLNTTLRTLLDQRDQDRILLEERVIANMNKLIMPALEKLKAASISRQAASFVGILEANLKEIVSPFSRQLSVQSASLTQTEIQIANCIMQGMRSKEIAVMMKLSKGTIDFYRNNIRKKLGIRNQKANLQSYLLAHFKM